MSITFETKWTAKKGTSFFIHGEKTGISNQVQAGSREVIPALIRPGGRHPGDNVTGAKILLSGKWIEASNYLNGTPHVWEDGIESTDKPDSIWLALPDGWYATSRRYIVSCSREQTLFKDGSTLNGDFALWFYAGLQRIDNAILYFTKESEEKGKVTFRQIGDSSKTFIAYHCQDQPTIHRYSGGGGPIFNSPIINSTPFKIRVIKGYPTTACGDADTIYSHPGCILSLSLAGSLYDFSHWRDIPTIEETFKKGKTVVLWDEEHQEILIYEDALTYWQVASRQSELFSLKQKVLTS